MAPHPRACAWDGCGQVFTPLRVNRHRKYCSAECRGEAISAYRRIHSTVHLMHAARRERHRAYWRERLKKFAPFSERDYALMAEIKALMFEQARVRMRQERRKGAA